VLIFPDVDSCLRLIRALAAATYESWLEANRYLNINEQADHEGGPTKIRLTSGHAAVWRTFGKLPSVSNYLAAWLRLRRAAG
jgi:hypothetical protein